ncbi:MAG TPA: bifunctional diaminohydroxyphosphoribosylaminopyrimidine deaminase/5-amino-6-(5-phosphoribosylamino)uracil reductase RibD [Bacteroidota bacterium]|nr:bifunctional diaminohydroxyphosphoribosylaminopyrimidine deaminase/5-amino-6-(5-phosphoribosylamino)uracil reductase RibD [Bacteroidota bacterium]
MTAEHPVRERDVQYMRECIDLARRGKGAVEPNPMVGALLVRDGRVVGRSWHKRFGGAHAEVEALRQAGDRARGATLYVSLEPCNHVGKTPPCTRAILEAGVDTVIIGMPDPNPDVEGNGAAVLRAAGVRVIEHVERVACEALNEVWLANTTHRRPFIRLKIAQTLDGFIAAQKGATQWITGEAARVEVHRQRADSQAVLIGAGTLRKDNPALTVRHVEGHSPLRVILTRSWQLPRASTVLTDAHTDRTVLITSSRARRKHAEEIARYERRGIRVFDVATNAQEYAALPAVTRLLHDVLGVRSMMVEGGAELFSAFLKAGLCDRLDCFTAPMVLGAGTAAFSSLRPVHISGAYRFHIEEARMLGEDLHTVLRPRKEDADVHRNH